MILGKHFLQDGCIEFAVAMCKNRCWWPVPFPHNLRKSPVRNLQKTSFEWSQGAMFLEGMEYSHPPQRYSVHRTCLCASHTNLAAQPLLRKIGGYPSSEDYGASPKKSWKTRTCNFGVASSCASFLKSRSKLRTCHLEKDPAFQRNGSVLGQTHLSTKQETFEQRGSNTLKNLPEIPGQTTWWTI